MKQQLPKLMTYAKRSISTIRQLPGIKNIPTRQLAFIASFGLIGSILLISSFAAPKPPTTTTPTNPIQYETAEASIDVAFVDPNQPASQNLTSSSWQTTTPLNSGVTQASALTISNTLYIFGGNAPITYGTPDANGHISQWQNNPANLPYLALAGKAIQIGDFVYFVGGSNSYSFNPVDLTDYVYIGHINADRTIGPWVRSTVTPGPGRRYGHGLFTTKAADGTTYLYVIGGMQAQSSSYSDTNTSTVRAKVIDSNTGALGPWETVGSFRLYQFNTAMVGNYAYIMGGIDGSSCSACGATGPLWRAPIDPTTGALGSFSTIGTVPTPASNGAGVGYAGKLYYHGGNDAWTGTSTGFNSALVNTSDGSIASWLSASGAPSREKHAMTIVNVNGTSYVYLIGGVISPASGNYETITREVWFSRLYEVGTQVPPPPPPTPPPTTPPPPPPSPDPGGGGGGGD